MTATAGTSAVKSADRVLAILDLLAERGTLTFSEVVEALALPKSSAHNLLATMLERQYIELPRRTARHTGSASGCGRSRSLAATWKTCGSRSSR